MKDLIEENAKHSPTAKICLDAFNAYQLGFNVLLQSDYTDQKSLEHIVEGVLLEDTFHLNMLIQCNNDYHKYSSFIKERCGENDAYGIFLLYGICRNFGQPCSTNDIHRAIRRIKVGKQ